jgi:hypothetical protein
MYYVWDFKFETLWLVFSCHINCLPGKGHYGFPCGVLAMPNTSLASSPQTIWVGYYLIRHKVEGVKSSLFNCVVKHYVTKVSRGVKYRSAILDLCSKNGTGHLHAPSVLHPGEDPLLYPLVKRLCESRIHSDSCREEKNLDPTRTRTPTPSVVQPVVRRYTNRANLLASWGWALHCSLSQINPVYTTPYYSLKICLNTHVRLGLPSCFFFLAFSPIPYMHSSSPPPPPPPHLCYMPCLSYLPRLDYSNYIWRRVQVMTFLIIKLSLTSVTFSLLGPNYSPQRQVLEHLQSVYFA